MAAYVGKPNLFRIEKLCYRLGGHPTALKEEEEGSKIKCVSLIVQLEEVLEGVQRSLLLLSAHAKKNLPDYSRLWKSLR